MIGMRRKINISKHEEKNETSLNLFPKKKSASSVSFRLNPDFKDESIQKSLKLVKRNYKNELPAKPLLRLDIR